MMIDGNFKIATDQLTLTFTEGQRQDFFIRHTPHRVEIIYPPQTDFEHLQPWLFKVVTEALRKQAKAILPPRIQELASRHGFRNWLPVTDSITPGSASILPVHVGEAAPAKDISTCRYT